MNRLCVYSMEMSSEKKLAYVDIKLTTYSIQVGCPYHLSYWSTTRVNYFLIKITIFY